MKKQSDILAHYPDILCQGQLCEAAHISKRRARYLLDKGLIPNVHSPNRRLGYRIRKEDARVFLWELKENPERYALPASARPRKPASPKLLEAYYLAQLESYPDILDAKQVIELTGYGTTSVHRWLSSGKLKSAGSQRNFCWPFCCQRRTARSPTSQGSTRPRCAGAGERRRRNES